MTLRTKKTLFLSLLFAGVLGALLTSCSTVNQYSVIVDAAIINNQLIILFHGKKHLDRGWREPEGGAGVTLNEAFGIGVCNLTDNGELKLTMSEKHAINPDPTNNYLYGRLCAPRSYLRPMDTWPSVSVKKFFGTNFPSIEGEFTANRFLLTPDRKIIIGYEGNAFVFDANSFQPISTKSSISCAETLCAFWTNGFWQREQRAAVNNDLNVIAVQTLKGDGWKQFEVWNLANKQEHRTIKVNDDIINLEAVEKINDKVFILYSSQSGGIDGQAMMSVVDENGVMLAKTESFGVKPIVDSGFDRILFLKEDAKDRNKLNIKIWHPKENKEESFKLDAKEAFDDLYNVWKTP